MILCMEMNHCHMMKKKMISKTLDFQNKSPKSTKKFLHPVDNHQIYLQLRCLSNRAVKMQINNYMTHRMMKINLERKMKLKQLNMTRY